MLSDYFWAENEARTRDPNLGKVVLYQLSYFRILLFHILVMWSGQGRIRTAEGASQQIYSLPVLTTYLPTQRFVTPAGFKPATFWSVVKCSIQLS